eukprot:g19.t1
MRHIKHNGATEWSAARDPNQPDYQFAERNAAVLKQQPGRVLLWKTERGDGCGADAQYQIFTWAIAEHHGWVYAGEVPLAKDHADNKPDYLFFGSDCQCMARFTGIPDTLHNRLHSRMDLSKGQKWENSALELKDRATIQTRCNGEVTPQQLDRFKKRHPKSEINVMLCMERCPLGRGMARVCLSSIRNPKFPCLDRTTPKCAHVERLRYDEYFNTTFIQKLWNGVSPNLERAKSRIAFAPDKFKVAVHIRRAGMGQKGKGNPRYVPQAYYRQIVEEIRKWLGDAADIHIFGLGSWTEYRWFRAQGCHLHLNKETDLRARHEPHEKEGADHTLFGLDFPEDKGKGRGGSGRGGKT